MNRKYGIYMMAFGMLLIAISLVTAENLAIVSVGVFDSCESAVGWTGVYGSLSLNSADKTEGSNSLMLTSSAGSWGMFIYKDGSWDFSSAPVLTFDVKVSWLGSGVTFGIWTGDGEIHHVTSSSLNTVTVGSWSSCYVDLSSAGVPISNVLRIEWDFNNYMTEIPIGTTMQIDNIQATTGGASPTPTPSTSPTPTPTPSATPTPAPGETPAPSASPNGTEPTPEPSLEPNATPTSPPSSSWLEEDDLNRIGVISGFGMCATGFVVYKPWKKKG